MASGPREADRLDDDGARLLAWHALAEVARNRADHEGSLRHYRALRAASGPDYIAQEIQGLQHLDRFHDAEVTLREARRDMGLGKGMIFLSLIYSQIWWDYNLGRLDEAGAGAATLLSLALERGSYTCGIDAASLLSLVALQRGDVARARQSLPRGFGPAGPESERRVPSLLLVRGWVTAAEAWRGPPCCFVARPAETSRCCAGPPTCWLEARARWYGPAGTRTWGSSWWPGTADAREPPSLSSPGTFTGMSEPPAR